MKTYEATFNNINTDGVFSISLVEDPATKETFIAMKNHTEIKLVEVDIEQRILIGLVLQPDQLIYRKQDGEEFNIVFRSDTIKELSHNFLKSGFQLNSKLEHKKELKGISIVESWLIENPKMDKSVNFGMEYPKGSWLVTMKIDNDELWNDYIKTGKVKGFSVDAMVSLKEINLKSNIEMAEEKKSFTEQVNDVLLSLGLVKEKTEIKLGSVKSGDIEIQYEGEELVAGVMLWVMQDEEKIPLPDGEYPTENGVLIAAEGKLVEVKIEEAPTDEVAASTPTPTTDEITQAIKSLLIKYSDDNKAEFEKLNTLVTEMKAENETLKMEVVELSNQPAAKSVKSEVKQKAYAEMSNYEKLKFNRGE